jgi:hypothetical protein
MKKFVKIMMLVFAVAILSADVNAQKKKTTKKTSAKKSAVKFTPMEFATPDSTVMLKDVADTNAYYASVNNLIGKRGVMLAYADSTFRPNDPLRRGDFIVSFNSALNTIKMAMESGMLDTVLVNTYDKNQTYITSVSDLTDLKDSSIYYPATQSLIEKWGIAAPFTKEKVLNPGGVMLENDVYDILKVTLGYNSPGSNPYAKAMTRGKFAYVLNNAVSEKLGQVDDIATRKRDSIDDVRRGLEMTMKDQEKMRKDSVAKEVELSKIEAQRKEAEAWNALSKKEKRKQIKGNIREQKN